MPAKYAKKRERGKDGYSRAELDGQRISRPNYLGHLIRSFTQIFFSVLSRISRAISLLFRLRTSYTQIMTTVAIAGAGPAGSSLAIRLARAGFDVTLIEREKFPRHKLCGEFISPECFAHFDELGVLDEMLASGGDQITETRFFSRSGKRVAVPSEWFGGPFALSLSRAAMDDVLLERARASGVKILEETSAVGLRVEKGRILAVIVRGAAGETSEVQADIFIGATGRARVLQKLAAKHLSRRSDPKTPSARIVAFKNHLKDVCLERGVCEIYFFQGGYGGVSHIEDGAANLCFLVRADEVKRLGSSTNRMLSELLFQNARAKRCLAHAEPVGDWLAVSIDRFGKKELRPAANLFTVGDSAAFIDPFTGSGMLMALEGSDILAQSICRGKTLDEIYDVYARNYTQIFKKRLRISAYLRKGAFKPHLAGAVIRALNMSRRPVELLAKATRGR